ncbi:protein GrpE-like [Ylistrum balloti]|uniref:protein GrpE-like n=1 Tax=Ylistrum balloti TaxID=509963 RepID=UPI0029058465|nr:protein GrpE-like [Ylistrum balloti]
MIKETEEYGQNKEKEKTLHSDKQNPSYSKEVLYHNKHVESVDDVLKMEAQKMYGEASHTEKSPQKQDEHPIKNNDTHANSHQVEKATLSSSGSGSVEENAHILEGKHRSDYARQANSSTSSNGDAGNTDKDSTDESKVLNMSSEGDAKQERTAHHTHLDGVSDADPQGSGKNDVDTEDESSRLKEEMLRLRADVENTKKRLVKLADDRVREKTSALLLDIIEHIDNFERATESQKHLSHTSETGNTKQKEVNAILEGVDMIKQQLLSNLESSWGLSIIKAQDVEFDPTLHEAIMREETDIVHKPTVTQVFMNGYMYLDRVIRPAKVKVALPKTVESNANKQ